MNWLIIIIFGVVVTGLVVFTIIRNLKDKRELEKKINNDYPKKKDEEGDIKTEE
jgi:low affinity Fe/Cu permease